MYVNELAKCKLQLHTEHEQKKTTTNERVDTTKCFATKLLKVIIVGDGLLGSAALLIRLMALACAQTYTQSNTHSTHTHTLIAQL